MVEEDVTASVLKVTGVLEDTAVSPLEVTSVVEDDNKDVGAEKVSEDGVVNGHQVV